MDENQQDKLKNSWIGSSQGFVAGAQSGNYYAAGAGAIIGGVSAYLNTPDKKGPALPMDQYEARLRDITDYQNQLNGAQSSWANAVASYNTTMMNLATPNLVAQAGARGLTADSGAVAAEVARQAAAYTAQGTQEVAKQNFQNINNVEKMRGDAWSNLFGFAGKNNQLAWNNDNENKAAMGGAVTNLISNVGNTYASGGFGNTWRQNGPTDYSDPLTSNFSPDAGFGNPSNKLDLSPNPFAGTYHNTTYGAMR